MFEHSDLFYHYRTDTSVSSRVHTSPQWPSLSQTHGSSFYTALHDSALQPFICSNYTTTSTKEHTTQNRHTALHCSITKSNSIERLVEMQLEPHERAHAGQTFLWSWYLKESHLAVCVSAGLWSHRPLPRTGPVGINICLLNPS